MKKSLRIKKLLAFALVAALTLCCAAFAEGLGEFSTVDTDGNTVTQEIFADYDLTMVNIWATWCGYCIDEMPEFAALKDRLPENTNLITICTDADTEPTLAQQVLDYANANFQMLLVSPEINSRLLSQVYAFPTTYFLDSNGQVVGDPIVGVPNLDNAGDAYYDYMMYLLGNMG